MEFLNALRFLTLIPVPGDENLTMKDIGRSTAWFPLIGAVIGGLLLFCHGIMGFLFQPMLSRILVVLIWVIVTRNYDIEKLIDNPPDDTRWEMKEKSKSFPVNNIRIGSFCTLAMICVLLIKFVALNELKWQFFSKALILAPILGCWSILIAIRFFPVEHQGEMGEVLATNCTNREFIIGTISAVVLAILLAGSSGMLFLLVAGGTACFSSWGITKLSEGPGENFYNIICEITEVVSLLTASFIMKFFLAGY